MSIKYLIANSLLCFVVFFLGIENYETWNHPSNLLSNEGIVLKKSDAKNENLPVVASLREPMAIQSHNLISERNIFSPNRKDFPIAAVDKSNPATRPQLVLYGVTIAGDFQAASVVNPGRSLHKGERETLTLKLGERIGGYTLAKIFPDRIAMEGNGDSFDVLLYDTKNPKRRVEARTETKPAMISSTPLAPVPTLGEAPRATRPQEPGEKPKEPVQAQARPQVATSLPFNKYTYQLLGPSAAISRGKIVSSPPGSPEQASVKK